MTPTDPLTSSTRHAETAYDAMLARQQSVTYAALLFASNIFHMATSGAGRAVLMASVATMVLAAAIVLRHEVLTLLAAAKVSAEADDLNAVEFRRRMQQLRARSSGDAAPSSEL